MTIETLYVSNLIVSSTKRQRDTKYYNELASFHDEYLFSHIALLSFL